MDFEGFQWDDGNIQKCQKHGVSAAEIESIFSRRVLLIHDVMHSEIEQRYRAIGIAMSGRHIFVVFTMRGDWLRPLGARYMHKKEVRRYEKDNSDLHER